MELEGRTRAIKLVLCAALGEPVYFSYNLASSSEYQQNCNVIFPKYNILQLLKIRYDIKDISMQEAIAIKEAIAIAIAVAVASWVCGSVGLWADDCGLWALSDIIFLDRENSRMYGLIPEVSYVRFGPNSFICTIWSPKFQYLRVWSPSLREGDGRQKAYRNRRNELWHEKVFAPDVQLLPSLSRSAMDWRVLMEAVAIERYKSITDRDVSSLGFASHSDERLCWVGASRMVFLEVCQVAGS
ncbi:hypothetical protein RND71_036073 [Anisodus tanguticus]|uniref:Uncharacterized protein n=1 Tax=Anisodus tanguticus TaxID=243964 RepID=A0AAE1R834_9SOLA|nr:hypothetical protein RND71_036073 [Anisodus tanguticus]